MEKLNVTKAQFIISVAESLKLPDFGMPEFAFVGRSNVGKSSLLNFLAGQKKLAKTSSRPGLTRLVNFFKINDNFMFVDLPGYGYAQGAKNEQQKWGKLIESYLLKSKNLKIIFLLLDIRHSPSEQDHQMLGWMNHYNLNYKILLTKADKISKSQMNNQKQKIASTLNIKATDIITTSSDGKIGKQEILDEIAQFLNQ